MATTGAASRRPAVRLRRPRRRGGSGEGLAASLFLLPSVVGFFIFTAFPVVAAIGLAFYDYDLLFGREFNGLQNFATSPRTTSSARRVVNTFYFTLASVPLSVVLGLGAALLVNQALRGVVLFRTIYLLPYVTVTVAVALVWRWIYLPDVGLMNTMLGWVGIDGPNWLTSKTWAMPALIIMSVWKTLRVQHGDLPRGAAGDPAAPVRRREGRRRDGVEALRAHHAADAVAHHAVRDGDLASSAPSRSSTRRW